MLKNLQEKESVQLKTSQTQPSQPKLTLVKIQNIDKEVAKNLAMYGNPLGLFTGTHGHKQNNKSVKNKPKTWIEK